MSQVVLVRGAGDLATGVLLRLYHCGFRALAAESTRPSAIRREAAFCEAVYDDTAVVEGVVCRRVTDLAEMEQCWLRREIPLIADETLACIAMVQPAAVVDAIIAKKNYGTNRQMAPITIGIGPGFTAGGDVDAVIETMRGHDLGRVLYAGAALPNTGIPGAINGQTALRVMHAPADGTIVHCAAIGDIVTAGQTLAMIGDVPLLASLDGVLRGLIRAGYPVKKGLKIADIDPRTAELKNCYTVSDKSRCIAGGVVEALLYFAKAKGIALL